MRALNNQYRNVATGEIVRAARHGHGPSISSVVPEKRGDWAVVHAGAATEVVSHEAFAAAHVPFYG